MPSSAAPTLHARLGVLRSELIDLAYTLDVRGAHTAADVAMTTSARLAELCAELAPSVPNSPVLSETRPLVR